MNKIAITTALSFLLTFSFFISCAQPTTPPVVYTVTFDSQEATTVANPASVTVTAPALTINPLPTALKTGYSFDGWWSQPLGAGSQFTSTTAVSGNMTLYAKWTVINLAVTFDTQGGSAIAGVNPAFGSLITQPAEPTKTGYTFGGWYKEAPCLTAWNFSSDTVQTATTLYAKWTANNYSVSFDSQGGSAVAEVSPAFGSLITQPSNPTRTGYTFGGWYKEAPCLTTWNFSSDTLLATTTLYAKWIVNNFAVTFDSQGGSAVVGVSPAFGSLFTKPADPTRTGYTFGGWYKEASCLTGWNFSSDTLLTATTLFAKWTVNNYAVTFDSQGGSSVTGSSLSYGSLITKPADPTRTGYTFGGWYREAPCWNAWTFTTNTLLTATSLYAKWIVNNYAVTFNSQGGSAVTGANHAFGSFITKPTDPTRTGYTFGGWYREAPCLTVWNFTSDTLLTTTTLYAKWTVNNYAITFNSQGGTTIAGINPAFGSLITKPADPTKTGYTFVGWYKLAAYTAWDFASDIVTGATTLYAMWDVIAYIVTLDSQGGSAVAGANINYGSLIAKPPNPTRNGYTFDAWYKEASCLTSWNFTSDTLLTATTLFAKWTINNYAVTFNSQGGSAVAGANINYGSLITQPADPTRTGYTFGGWYKESPCLTVWNFTSDTLLAATSLYAKWTAITYLVSFDSQGAETPANPLNKTVPYPSGSLTSLPASPTKNGYALEGWWTEPNGVGTKFTTSTVVLADMTVYANWLISTPGLSFIANGVGYLVSKGTANTNGAVIIPEYWRGEKVTGIGDQAFYNCSGLTSLTIPAGVTSIVDQAFYNCTGLTSLTIPAGVTSIGDNTFYNCSGLTSLTIPAGVTSIGSYAFQNCSGLTSLTIPAGVTSIGSHAFQNCSGLTSLTIPAGVTTIESEAFAGCSGLTSLTIPDGVTTIGIAAFYGCSGLTSLTIPAGVTSIGDYAFQNCSGLTSLTIPAGVTTIESEAFAGCSGLTNLTIPAGVTTIGYNAFYGCSGLTSLTIPAGVTSIGDEAFRSCSGLTSLTIPAGVTSIGSYAFSSCTGLTSLTLPAGVTAIGAFMFSNCSGLTSLTIPTGVTSIGDYAFYNCSRLTSLTLPAGLNSIGTSVFSGCEGLTSLLIPAGVTTIGSYAFYNCSRLTSLTIPAGVTSIGDSAFYYCIGLTSIFVNPVIPPTVSSSVFWNTTASIKVPAGSVDAYKAAPGWNVYASKIVSQ